MSMPIDHTLPTRVSRTRIPRGRPDVRRRVAGWLLLCALLPLQHACTCISFADPTWDRRHPDVFDVPTDDGEEDGDAETEADVDPWIELQCDDLCSRLRSACDPDVGEWSCRADCVGWDDDDRDCRLARLREAELLAGTARDEACRMAGGDEACVDPCALYCDTVLAFCRGANAPFPDATACLERCASWTREEAPWCAIEHARAAELDPDAECRRADEDGCLCWSRGTADGCLPGSTACDTPLDTLDHCGACGVACADGERCVRASDLPPIAACRPACADGLRCGETCVDPLTDPARCGAASCTDGTACATGEVCDGTGRCSAGCAPGLDDCGRCTDLDADPLHCGACDHACGPRQLCAGGTCTCDGFSADCNGDAADGCEVLLADDPAHCGACDIVCTPGETCAAGRCVATPIVLAAGGSHTCALQSGVVWCWGRNDCGCPGPEGCGVLGTGDTDRRLRPTAVADLPAARDVEAGVAHTCALLEDGAARCWGCHGSGQLGTGLTGTSTVAPATVLAPPLAALAAGGWRTCARTVAGKPLCWGERVASGGMIWGIAYEPLAVDFPTPERLAVGGDRVCAAGAGRAWCFGENDDGLLGAGTWYSPVANALRIVGLPETVDLAAGSNHACALAATGEVRCWGANGLGQAGPGPDAVPEPQLVELGGPAVLLAAGFDASCAVRSTGELRCWGALLGGRADPYVVDLPAPAVAVAVGGAHFCAAAADGTVRCWGRNEDGQLGDGTTTPHLTPTAVTFE